MRKHKKLFVIFVSVVLGLGNAGSLVFAEGDETNTGTSNTPQADIVCASSPCSYQVDQAGESTSFTNNTTAVSSTVTYTFDPDAVKVYVVAWHQNVPNVDVGELAKNASFMELPGGTGNTVNLINFRNTNGNIRGNLMVIVKVNEGYLLTGLRADNSQSMFNNIQLDENGNLKAMVTSDGSSTYFPGLSHWERDKIASDPNHKAILENSQVYFGFYRNNGLTGDISFEISTEKLGFEVESNSSDSVEVGNEIFITATITSDEVVNGSGSLEIQLDQDKLSETINGRTEGIDPVSLEPETVSVTNTRWTRVIKYKVRPQDVLSGITYQITPTLNYTYTLTTTDDNNKQSTFVTSSVATATGVSKAISVKKIPLEITSNSASYKYDGTEHTVTEGTINGTPIKSGESVDIVINGITYNVSGLSILAKGTNVNGYPATINTDNMVITVDGDVIPLEAFDIKSTEGKLTITPVEEKSQPKAVGRTCQDDGYPAGYSWNDKAQACVLNAVTGSSAKAVPKTGAGALNK